MAEALEAQIVAAELLINFQGRMLKTPKDKRTTGWLKTNLSALEEQWKEFRTQHLHLPRDAKLKENPYYTDDTYDTVQNHYLEVKNMILNALQPGRAQSTVEADEDFDEVPSIAPVMKLQYLLASLTGEAAKRLSNTKIKAANYEGAWETLTNKYDNLRVNISSHIQSITLCPPVARKSEAEISRVLTVILEAKRGLENLECPVQHWDAWLVFHTLEKLDDATREDWEMHLGEDPAMPTFDKLFKFLNTYGRALATAHGKNGVPKPQSATSSYKPTGKPKNARIAQAHMVFAEPADKTKRNKARMCLYCKEQHNLSSCERYRSFSVSQRVVFNALQPSTNGNSLNHVLLPGPKLQGDIWTVLMLWRLWKIVFTADIVKMFRQIRIELTDTPLQLIIWRERPEENLQTHRLLTVTYGTSSAPYLANRVLIELANGHQRKYPKGAKIVRCNKYVDEFFADDTLEEATEIKDELTSLLGEDQFLLSKWATNCPALVKEGAVEPESKEKTIKTEECVWALGTAWLPNRDCFTVKVRQIKRSTNWTKRAVLSEIAKLYDPLGWLGPVVIRAKALMQELWLSGIGWDESLPPNLLEQWERFCKELPELTTIQIHRWFGTTSNSTLQLHAFSDASERAYAACVYIVAINGDERSSSLVIGKTKVAPIKTLSIPRLELCGAQLAARLVTAVKAGLQDHLLELFCWTDSKQPEAVTSRRYYRRQDGNMCHPRRTPADLASRGASPAELRDSELWWSGPAWLVHGDHPSGAEEVSINEMPERRSNRGTALVSQVIDEGYILRFSTYSKLIRITAYCLRIARYGKSGDSQATSLSLSSQEITSARNTLIKGVQEAFYQTEVKALRAGSSIPSSSSLVPLRPFLDDKGLLRVAGRLAQSTLPYGEKHPIILPKTSAFTDLLIDYAHKQTLHGGRQLTLSWILRAFWIVHGKAAVRSVLKNCIRCARFNARPEMQLMGSLPPFRIEEARPFLRSGVDYAGPIDLRTAKGRGHKSHKGYLCIFVCLAIKAVHIEIASDLSTASFLAAYKRFTGRRGRCEELLSDNGTNFHGADAELRKLFREASTLDAVSQYFANEGTTWKFIPPGAPHFGGLWEAAVKSTKRHLRKVIGEATLTYEELSTLTTQVEACLNSRPLFVPSSDGKDVPPITPAHYLIGAALTAPPEPYDEGANGINPINRWVLITKMRNQFWRSWRQDYLHTLQQRSKWHKPSANIAVGDVVLLTNENTPPTKWALGRIVSTFPGSDGLVRVVEVKTANSTFKRPVNKICKLPVLNENLSPEEVGEV